MARPQCPVSECGGLLFCRYNYTLGSTAEDGSHYTVAVNGWQVFQELKPLMTTNATFFQPDSRHKHSDFTHENSTLGEFCFALMWYPRDSDAQGSFGNFRCCTITHNDIEGRSQNLWDDGDGDGDESYGFSLYKKIQIRPIFEITVFLANTFLGNFGKSVGLPTRWTIQHLANSASQWWDRTR